MLKSMDEINKWKREQLTYFKRHIRRYSRESTEYKIIETGIKQIEGSMLDPMDF